MISKLDSYLEKALCKRVPICATILDPRFKIGFFQAHFDSLEGYHTSAETLKACFIKEAEKFSASGEVMNISPSGSKRKSSFENELFEFPINNSPSIHNEITRYLSEPLEKGEDDILGYWKARQNTYPLLGVMARSFLAVPATSSPSDVVFAEGKALVRYQDGSFTPDEVESILCVKEWYQRFGALDESDTTI
jgi:hypothetical protein